MSETPVCPRLSAQELEILRLICQGYRNSHIANILGFTYRRAQKKVTRLYRRVGAADRRELIAHAFASGLAPSPTGDVAADTAAALVRAYGLAPHHGIRRGGPCDSTR